MNAEIIEAHREQLALVALRLAMRDVQPYGSWESAHSLAQRLALVGIKAHACELSSSPIFGVMLRSGYRLHPSFTLGLGWVLRPPEGPPIEQPQRDTLAQLFTLEGWADPQGWAARVEEA